MLLLFLILVGFSRCECPHNILRIVLVIQLDFFLGENTGVIDGTKVNDEVSLRILVLIGLGVIVSPNDFPPVLDRLSLFGSDLLSWELLEMHFNNWINPITEVLLSPIDFVRDNKAFSLNQRYNHLSLYGAEVILDHGILVFESQAGLSDLNLTVNLIEESLVVHSQIYDPVISAALDEVRFLVQLVDVDSVWFKEFKLIDADSLLLLWDGLYDVDIITLTSCKASDVYWLALVKSVSSDKKSLSRLFISVIVHIVAWVNLLDGKGELNLLSMEV